MVTRSFSMFLVLMLALTSFIETSAQKNKKEPNKAVKKTTTVRLPKMEFAKIQAGKFQMGGTTDFEKPIHTVKISQRFWMQTTEVTQAQWEAAMGNNPSNFKNCPRCPVETVSWEDAQMFIEKLNARNDGYKYRLPTEAEWEYAARAGTTGDYAGNVDAMAWYSVNSDKKTHPVGTKQPNAWGLYDMHGNVQEWVQDWFGDYSSEAVKDPVGPSSGKERTFRGGDWNSTTKFLRSAVRLPDIPQGRWSTLGFRVVRQ